MKLGSGKLYPDSLHKNSVFQCLEKTDQVESQMIKTTKKLSSSIDIAVKHVLFDIFIMLSYCFVVSKDFINIQNVLL